MTDEILAVELAGKPCHLGGNIVGQLVPVERHCRLQTQRIARAQSAGNEPKLLASLQQRVPQPDGVFRLAENLVAERAGVARAGDIGFRTAPVPGKNRLRERIVLDRKLRLVAELHQNLLRHRTLYRDLPELVARVMIAGMTGQVRFHPRRVLVAVAGVDDNQVIVLRHAVDNQIVDHAAFVVAEHAVTHVAVKHFGNIGRDEVLNVLQRVLAMEDQLSHVRHIKKTCLFAHCHMFGKNARRILHRH